MDRAIVGNITRSNGVIVGGHIVGSGNKGVTEQLNDAVQDAAKILRDHFRCDVTIRFNSSGKSGGAWVVYSQTDCIGANSRIGLGASLRNSKLMKMGTEKISQLPKNDLLELLQQYDVIWYDTAIDVKRTENSVNADSPYILFDSEYRSFRTLDEAATYLFSHATRVKSDSESMSGSAERSKR